MYVVYGDMHHTCDSFILYMYIQSINRQIKVMYSKYRYFFLENFFFFKDDSKTCNLARISSFFRFRQISLEMKVGILFFQFFLSLLNRLLTFFFLDLDGFLVEMVFNFFHFCFFFLFITNFLLSLFYFVFSLFLAFSISAFSFTFC